MCPRRGLLWKLERLLYRERSEIKAEIIREDSNVLTKYDRMDIVDTKEKTRKEEVMVWYVVTINMLLRFNKNSRLPIMKSTLLPLILSG